MRTHDDRWSLEQGCRPRFERIARQIDSAKAAPSTRAGTSNRSLTTAGCTSGLRRRFRPEMLRSTFVMWTRPPAESRCPGRKFARIVGSMPTAGLRSRRSKPGKITGATLGRIRRRLMGVKGRVRHQVRGSLNHRCHPGPTVQPAATSTESSAVQWVPRTRYDEPGQ
jgi:hypothetical protein